MLSFNELQSITQRMNFNTIENYCPNYYEIREYLLFLLADKKNKEMSTLINDTIDLCNLIEYIINYEDVIRVDKLDELLEKLDIKILHLTYEENIEYKIYSNDIYTIISNLRENLKLINSLTKSKLPEKQKIKKRDYKLDY